MNLSKLNRSRITLTASRWQVPRDYFDPLMNYLIHGFEPGSMWMGVLANDWRGAIQSSHPANTIDALKMATGWIHDTFPEQSFGSYAQIAAWMRLSAHDRRMILEGSGLLLTEQQEIMHTLKGSPVEEHTLY